MSVPAYDMIHHGGEVRTKSSHPYNYDPIRHYSAWVGGKRESAYDDRMEGWDRPKFNAAVDAIRMREGNRFGYLCGYSDPELTCELLRVYYDAPKLEVTDIVETCNQATGYACWYFEFVREPTAERPPA